MRIQLQYKKKLTKTDKQKKANAEKKKKGPKLSSNYKDMSPYEADNVDLSLNQMRYGIVESCNVTSVKLQDGVIKLKSSWTELILIMLDTIISNNSANFNEILSKNEVLNMFFCVDTTYGKYTFDEKQYKAYKIFDSGYYLEAVFDSNIILDAIVGLTKCLEIPLDQIEFHLVNKVYSNINLNFDILEDTEQIISIDELIEMLKPGIHMVSVKILGEAVQAHRLDVALIAICNKLFDEFGIFKISILPSNSSTGVKILEDGDELNKNIVKIRNSEIGIYSDGNENGIIQFIKESMMQLELNSDDILFKFRTLNDKSKAKKYEV